MRELDKIAEKLFDKIRTKFEDINLGDEKSKRTSDPEKARFFNFDYISNKMGQGSGESGKNFGNVTVSIVDGDSLKIYFSKNITDKLEHEEQDEWFDFLRNIRQFAKQNFLSFDARDINKSNLDLRDIKQQSKADAKFTSADVSGTSAVAESAMYGTRNMSFQEAGPVKIRIKHSTAVDEERRGARSRNIESIFLDNHLGERFLLPFTNLHGARAMAQHCSQGGKVDDELGASIAQIVNEMNAMRHFVREAKRRQFEDVETSQMATAAVKHYGELKDRLLHIGNHRGYSAYKESFEPSPDIEEDIDIEGLRSRFEKRYFNPKFEEALPYVYRAYKQQQEAVDTPMGNQFEDWVSNVTEDAFESDDQKVDALKELMAAPIQVGQDAFDAINALRPIFDDEELVSDLEDLAATHGEEADSRQTVLDWMRKSGMGYIADDIEEELQNQEEQPAEPEPEEQPAEPAAQPDPNAAPVDPNMQPPQPDPNAQQPAIPTESADPLALIRYLAGMGKR